jgi:hypothetical protein
MMHISSWPQAYWDANMRSAAYRITRPEHLKKGPHIKKIADGHFVHQALIVIGLFGQKIMALDKIYKKILTLNHDEVVKSQKFAFYVIPGKAGIY